jgi:hypothetical protein
MAHPALQSKRGVQLVTEIDRLFRDVVLLAQCEGCGQRQGYRKSAIHSIRLFHAVRYSF